MFGWILAGAATLAVIFLLICYICHYLAFCVPKNYLKKPTPVPGKWQYDAVKEESIKLIAAAEALPCEDVYCQSHDGYRLRARLYKTDPNAPVQILFHGYRSRPLKDFSGGLQLALSTGCNCILVDQRAHGESEGRCLSFGVLERYDALSWVNFAKEMFGNDTPIILTGISMGAGTVLMSLSLELPKNVVGVVADCPYSSPREILCEVLKQRRYPVSLAYFALRIGARLFGRFDTEAMSPTEAVQKSKLPILLLHGENDLFVPVEMSRKIYEAASDHATLLTFPDAGHGLSYLTDNARYTAAVKKFVEKHTGYCKQ